VIFEPLDLMGKLAAMVRSAGVNSAVELFGIKNQKTSRQIKLSSKASTISSTWDSYDGIRDGLRLSEVVSLRLSDIDSQRMVIRVE
jgi:hypothetical protein